MSVRLSADIGGTFTDVVLDRDGELTTTKVLTTYADPAAGVMQGVQDLLAATGTDPASVSIMLHGTTLATNALIERRGAPTGLLTTAGHRDALEMAFENRFEQYDVNIDRPQPLVPRHWRLGVPERMSAEGDVLVPLDEDEVLRSVERLVADEVTSLAVGFLHSYAAPEHEQRVAALVQERFPELSITLSSDVCPEIREYERISTAVANAYVKPLMATYLASLEQQLVAAGFGCQVLMMTSGGGLTTLQTASRYPIRLVESGPAGGAILASHLAREHNHEAVVSFDMGGTTAKICLIDGGEPQHSRAFEVDRSYRFKKGSGLPVRIPVIEMVEIGAGGGSIATVDGLKRLQVGPESAGSEPGPACYGRGGENATVTDADVVLGRLSPHGFAGGRFSLHDGEAAAVLRAGVAEPLSLSASEAAFAVSEIVEENMASATRAHAAEWGREAAGRCLVAFGGAAPLHAATLARKLKISRVLIPAGAGVGSAVGFLLAPVRFEVVRSAYMRLDALQETDVEALFADMRTEAAAVVGAAVTSLDDCVEERHAYMRYVGQGYEVAVPIGNVLELDAVRAEFEAAYRMLYGRTIPDMAVEILSWTLALTAPVQQERFSYVAHEAALTNLPEAIDVYEGERYAPAKVVSRSALEATSLAGPALVIEPQTTTFVPAGAHIERCPDGSLLMTLE